MGFQDNATSLGNHERFVRRVVASREVWGLKSPAGWAVSDSNETLVDDEDARAVIPFWSDRAYAKRAASGVWADYEPTPIPLDLFIDRWLRGMHEDGTLVGTNWDAVNCGIEIEPVELAQQLVAALDRATEA